MLKRFWRVGFRLLYNELAFTYDVVSRIVSLGHWRCWQRSLFSFMGPPQSGPVLELAHGTGDLQVDLLREGYRTVALDLSPTMGQIAQRKLQRMGFRGSLLRADVFNLPLKSESFAAIVCAFPTPFIFQPETLAELKRVLTVDGSVDIVLAGQLYGRGPVKAIIRSLYWLMGQTQQLLTEGNVRDFFRDSGFYVQVEVVPCNGSAVQVVRLSKIAENSESESTSG